MKALIYYKHISNNNHVSYNFAKISPEDRLYIYFQSESNNEEQLFPEEMNPLPYATLVKWAKEYEEMETALNTLGVETEVKQNETV